MGKERVQSDIHVKDALVIVTLRHLSEFKIEHSLEPRDLQIKTFFAHPSTGDMWYNMSEYCQTYSKYLNMSYDNHSRNAYLIMRTCILTEIPGLHLAVLYQI